MMLDSPFIGELWGAISRWTDDPSQHASVVALADAAERAALAVNEKATSWPSITPDRVKVESRAYEQALRRLQEAMRAQAVNPDDDEATQRSYVALASFKAASDRISAVAEVLRPSSSGDVKRS